MTGAVPLRRTQAERRAESDRNLLQAAAGLVAGQGVAALTLENVGARAGYSRGLATQKYGSKQGLIEALIVHLHGRMEALLHEAHVEHQSGRDAVLTFARILLQELGGDVEVRAYFMLMAGAVADRSPGRAAFAASHETVSQRLQALIVRGHHDGSIPRDTDAAQATLLIGSLLLGLSTQYLVDPALDLAAELAPACAFIARLLGAP